MTRSTPGSTTPPGWYPDPSDPRLVRWWDGHAWTAHQAPLQAPQQVQYQPVFKAPRTPISEQTPVYTPFIWAITLLPLVSVLFMLTWQPEFRVITTRQGVTTLDPFSIYTPGYFLLMASSLVIYGLSVFFAYLDHQRLARSGVVRPFHWAWTFLNSAVYVIGRSVIVNKVAPKRGLLPVWITIAVFVISMVVAGIWTSTMMQTMVSSFGSSLTT